MEFLSWAGEPERDDQAIKCDRKRAGRRTEEKYGREDEGLRD